MTTPKTVSKQSPFLTLKLNDFWKGFIIAFLSAILTGAYELIQKGGDIGWPSVRMILMSGIGAAVAYLIKNLLTNNKDEFLKKDKPGN